MIQNLIQWISKVKQKEQCSNDLNKIIDPFINKDQGNNDDDNNNNNNTDFNSNNNCNHSKKNKSMNEKEKLIKNLKFQMEENFTQNREFLINENNVKKIIYNLYIILCNHMNLFIEMIQRQIFDDDTITEEKDKVMIRPFQGFYDKFYPHPDSTFRAGNLPDLSTFFFFQHLDFKDPEQAYNSIYYILGKSFPSTCQIRKIADMVKEKFRTSEHVQKFLLSIILVSLLGTYPDANHQIMSQNIPFLLKFHSTYFKNIIMNGKNLEQRKIDLFYDIMKNKYVIVDILREFQMYLISYMNPTFIKHYEKKWLGKPHLHFLDFKISCTLNSNYLREFYTLKSKIPTELERFTPAMYKEILKNLKLSSMKRLLSSLKKYDDNKKQGLGILFDKIINKINDSVYAADSEENAFVLKVLYDSEKLVIKFLMTMKENGGIANNNNSALLISIMRRKLPPL